MFQRSTFINNSYTSVKTFVLRTWSDPVCVCVGGGHGVRIPLKNHKNIGFLSNTGPDPLKNHKATKPALKCWAIIGPPAKRHLHDRPIMAHL